MLGFGAVFEEGFDFGEAEVAGVDEDDFDFQGLRHCLPGFARNDGNFGVANFVDAFTFPANLHAQLGG